jgi:predicted Zn-dependent protease
VNREAQLESLAARLRALQARECGFTGWELVALEKTGEQRLVDGAAGNRLTLMQSRHAVREYTVTVQVYVRHGSPEVMGTSGATLDPLGDPDAQFRACLAAARASGNPPWELPAPAGEPIGHPLECDPALLEDLPGATDALLSSVEKSAAGLEGVRINAAELYADVSKRTQLLSTGIRVERNLSEIYFECAMEPARAETNTQEVHNVVRGVHQSSLDLPAFMNECAEETRALGCVEVPRSDPRAVVLVRAEALNQILHALLGQLDLSAEYHKRPHLKEGEAVHAGELTGEPLELALDPFLDYMAESGAHTREGLPASRGNLVAGGRVALRVGSHRMAQYLGRPWNGVYGNLVVPPGRLGREELIAGCPRVIEVKAFSSLLVSSDTLTWSSEIKLAVLHEPGRAPVFLKGGVMAGDIRQNLAAAFYSRETRRVNQTEDGYHPAMGYEGPRWARFGRGVSVSGRSA